MARRTGERGMTAMGTRLRPARDGGSEPHRRLFYSGQPRTPLLSTAGDCNFRSAPKVPGRHHHELRRASTSPPRFQGRGTHRPGGVGATRWSFAFHGHEQNSDTVICEPAPSPACARIRRDESAQALQSNPRNAAVQRGRSQAWAFVHPHGTRWVLPASLGAGRDADGLRVQAAAPGVTGKVATSTVQSCDR